MPAGKRRMKKVGFFVLALLFWAVLAPPATPGSKLPPPPSSKPPVRPDAVEERKAMDLYKLVHIENRRLFWDRCLAGKAFVRAKELVSKGYFQHRDPKTGNNPAWELVRRCYRYRSAGENLIKGMESPEIIHNALMNSPTHRKNILDSRFRRVGIGCYDYVCVQLFSGF